MLDSPESPKPPVTKELITEQVYSAFGEILSRGYEFNIQDLNEYFEGSEMTGQMWYRELPRADWNKVFSISLLHRDHPVRARWMYPLEFIIADSPDMKEIRLGNFALDPGRENQGEGVKLIQALAQFAKQFGFDRINLSGGPYLERVRDKDGNSYKHRGEAPNILDWYQSKFPKTGNLRQRVEVNPAEAFLKVENILE